MQIALSLLFASLTLLLIPSCGSDPSIRQDALIVVKDVQIPDDEPLLAQFATHSWVDYRPDVRSSWRRIEIVNKNSGLLHHRISDEVAHGKKRWNERVRILSQSDGKKNPHFVRDIMRFAKNYDASVYRVWPGPNSNTFAERLMREVDGVSGVLDHNAVGKEHGFYVGRSAGGTGVEFQTPLVGVGLGLREGVEISLFGLSGGVSFYPPALKVPVLQRVPRK